jgi:hypothetical protein
MEFHQIFINQLYIFDYKIQISLSQCSRSLYILFKNIVNANRYDVIKEYYDRITFFIKLRVMQQSKALTLEQLFKIINYDTIPYTPNDVILPLLDLDTGYSNYYPITINKNIDINCEFNLIRGVWKLSYDLYKYSNFIRFIRNINFIPDRLTLTNYDFKYTIIYNSHVILDKHNRLPPNLLYPFYLTLPGARLILEIEANLNGVKDYRYDKPKGWISYDTGHLRDVERTMIYNKYTKYEYKCCDNINDIINCTNPKCSLIFYNYRQYSRSMKYMLCNTPEQKHNEYKSYQIMYNSSKKFNEIIDNSFNNSSYFIRKLILQHNSIIILNTIFISFVHDIIISGNTNDNEIQCLIRGELYEEYKPIKFRN